MIRIFLVMSLISIVSLVQSAEKINIQKKRKHLNSINLPFWNIGDDQCRKYLNEINEQRKKQFNKVHKGKKHITPIS